MKNKNMVGLFGLMVAGGVGFIVSSSVALGQKTLSPDLSNAQQHINSVTFVDTNHSLIGAKRPVLSNARGLVRIVTENFLITMTGERSNYIQSSLYSTILGGINNTIFSGKYSAIIAGSGNSINSADGVSSYSVIGGGVRNQMIGSDNSTIAGGRDNLIDGSDGSTIVGGRDNHIIMGNSSAIVGVSNHVEGDNSVVMGQGAKIKANNSFLWTDGSQSRALTADDVFAIISENGMAVNTEEVNKNAQLTIGGSLVIGSGKRDVSLKCGEGEGAGIIKLETNDGRNCLCACDGHERNSLIGHGECQSVCRPQQPVCGSTLIKNCEGLRFRYEGSCEVGNVVDGSYFIGKEGKIYRTCQAQGAETVMCEMTTPTGSKGCSNTLAPTPDVFIECVGEEPVGASSMIMKGPGTYSPQLVGISWQYDENAKNSDVCKWKCREGYVKSGNTCKPECDDCGSEPESEPTKCTGTIPANAQKNNSRNPVGGDKPYYWRQGPSSVPCTYSCKNGYVYKNGQCVLPDSVNCMDGFSEWNEIKVGGMYIMDRNLGAKKAGMDWRDENVIGCYFQWGNGYGFSRGGDVNFSTDQINVSDLGPNEYAKNLFIKGHTAWDISDNRKLWGGVNDKGDNLWGFNLNVDSTRRGPCPEGWHVPSAGEWGALIRAWAKENGLPYGGQDNLFEVLADQSAIATFMRKAYLPLVGLYDTHFESVDVGRVGYYWTSTPLNDAAFSLKVTDNEISIKQEKQGRADGLPIRCFKDNSKDCTFNGRTVKNGESIDAYQTTSAPCNKETRTCNNGVLAGTYQYASCPVGSQNCSATTLTGFDVPALNSGEGTGVYRLEIENGSSCQGVAQCTNGTVTILPESVECDCYLSYIYDVSTWSCVPAPFCSSSSSNAQACESSLGEWNEGLCKCVCPTNYSLNDDGECEASQPQCGSAHGQSFSMMPVNNLCSIGNPTAVSENIFDHEYNWQCMNGGRARYCFANRISNCRGLAPTGVGVWTSIISIDAQGGWSYTSQPVDEPCKWTCMEGYYHSQPTSPSRQFVQEGCLACPQGYTSDYGADEKTDCYMDVPATYYLNAGDSQPTACPLGKYSSGHRVYWGNSSSCSDCNTPLDTLFMANDWTWMSNGSSASNCSWGCKAGYYKTFANCTRCSNGYTSNTGATRESQCYINVPAKKYLATPGSTSFTNCTTGTYKSAHTVYYGQKSSCSACTNRPNNNAVYTSNSDTNNCSWQCKNPHQPNSAYTLDELPSGFSGNSYTYYTGDTCQAVTKYKKTGCTDSRLQLKGDSCVVKCEQRAWQSVLHGNMHDQACINISSPFVICSTNQQSLLESCGNVSSQPHSNGCYSAITPENSCFINGTQVTMSDGTQKNIEDVKIGEKVLGSNGVVNTVLGYDRPVLGERNLWSINGSEYFVSDEHPFMTTEGWKSFNPEMTKLEVDLDTKELKVGDVLIGENSCVKIYSLDSKKDKEDTQLYNLVLDGDHTYYANGYLVHNKTNNPYGDPCGASLDEDLRDKMRINS